MNISQKNLKKVCFIDMQERLKKQHIISRLQKMFFQHNITFQCEYATTKTMIEDASEDISSMKSVQSSRKYPNHYLDDLQTLLIKQLMNSLSDILNEVFDLQNQQSIFNSGITSLIIFCGLLKIDSINRNNCNKILKWIYDLISMEQSLELCTLISSIKKKVLNLGFSILRQVWKEKISPQSENQEQFKQEVFHLIKQKQQLIQQLKYQICRICQSSIPINILASHTKQCEQTHQLKYYLSKIEQKGNYMLSLTNQMLPQSQERYEMKVFFNRLFNNYGNVVATFLLKNQTEEIGKVILQYKGVYLKEIYQETIQLLEKYLQLLEKNEDICDTLSDKGSKINKVKIMNRTKFNLGSNTSLLERQQPQYSQQSQFFNIQFASQKTINTDSEAILKFQGPKLYDFEILSQIGKGAFSQVYLVRKKNTKDLFAMKVIEIENLNEQKITAFKKEQKIYKSISGGFNIKLYYSFSQDNLYFFILDYGCGGNLRHLLEQQVYIEQRYAKVYLANLILAVNSIHSMGIVHRDLKPENLVINQLGQLILTDFNLSKLIKDSNNEKEGTFFGTPDYIAPEVLKNKTPDKMIDWFSVGVIAYQMVIGATPFADTSPQLVFENILKGNIQWPQIGQQQGQISLQCKQIIQALLNPDPAKRFGSAVQQKNNNIGIIEEMRKFKFFEGIDLNKISQCEYLYVPLSPVQFQEDSQLFFCIQSKKKKSSMKFIEKNSIVRYDMLKCVTNKNVRSHKNSRFKLQKQLQALKLLPSTQNFRPKLRKHGSFDNFNQTLSNKDTSNIGISCKNFYQQNQQCSIMKEPVK